jgi:hypothetical protein
VHRPQHSFVIQAPGLVSVPDFTT